MSAEKNSAPGAAWWGPLALPMGQRAFVRVGPLALGFDRYEHEWRVWHAPGTDPVDERVLLELPSAREAPEDAEHARFGFGRSPDVVGMAPVLADRPVVLRPETPLFVPTGETVEIFASTPVFVRLDFRNDESIELELPSYRMSDTWFGPTTGDGELCYASRTHAQLSANQLSVRPHRAMTQITVDNQGSDALHVERLKLPVEHLSVFAAEDHSLWTETVRYERGDDQGRATISVGERPPGAAGEATSLGRARKSERTLVSRVFDALLSRERSWSR